MERSLTRTLDESERRRIAARMLASVPGGPAVPHGAPVSSSRPRRNGGAAIRVGLETVRRRKRRVRPARLLVPLLLELPAKLGFPAAFCAAAAAWSAAVVLALGCFGVVGR